MAIVEITRGAANDGDVPGSFQLGDVVTLKSDVDVGMTVKSATKTKVTVEWMNGNNDLNTADFHPKQLRLKQAPEAESDG